MKVNLIYNSDARNNGTPIHFWHAMKEEGIDFVRYSPGDGLRPCDFSIYIDDGRDDLKWLPPRPWGYYATDTHLGWDYRRWKAGEADIVWCAQKPAADRMRYEGLNAYWVPLASNPLAHPTEQELIDRGVIPKVYGAKRHDIGFVGYLQSPETSTRIEFLDRLFKSYPNFITAFGVFHEDMARIYHQCRIGINHAIRDDLNMRFFELASVGVAQLCDRRMVGLGELGFTEGQDYIGYGSTEEAVWQVAGYLHDEESLKEMAASAFEKVRTKHTYRHRIQAMMATIHEFRTVAV